MSKGLVVNRTTFECFSNVVFADYPVEDWIHGPELSHMEGVPLHYWKVIGDTIDEMTQVEKDSADLLRLPELKEQRFEEIDGRTGDLIEQGFEFPPESGLVFSLSREFQLMLSGLNQERDAPEVSYPIEWNTKDDSGKLSLTDASMVRSFYLTAMGTVLARRNSGTALKDQIRAASTVAEVDAVVDER